MLFSKAWEGRLDGLDKSGLAQTIFEGSVPPKCGRRTLKPRVERCQAEEVAETISAKLSTLSGLAMVHISKETGEFFVLSEVDFGIRGRFSSSRQSEVVLADM